jgi:hypothetical protein
VLLVVLWYHQDKPSEALRSLDKLLGELQNNTMQYIYPPLAATRGAAQEGKGQLAYTKLDSWSDYVEHFKTSVLVRGSFILLIYASAAVCVSWPLWSTATL